MTRNELHESNLNHLKEIAASTPNANVEIELSFFCNALHNLMAREDMKTYEHFLGADIYNLKYATIFNTDESDDPTDMTAFFRIQGKAEDCLNSWEDIEEIGFYSANLCLQKVTKEPASVMYSKEDAEKLVRKATLSQMATEVNTFYKSKKHLSQFTVQGRQVIYLDYSIPTLKQKYGIAPIYVKANAKDWLRSEYKFLKEGRLL